MKSQVLWLKTLEVIGPEMSPCARLSATLGGDITILTICCRRFRVSRQC